MTEHSVFYYPYASFTNAQLPLLKAVALYFDKLYILDPVGASWATIGADLPARDAVKLLREANLLTTITPSEVLSRYEKAIEEEIRSDLQDIDFQALCLRDGRQGRWTLALAKVPKQIQQDRSMRHLMGDFARGAAEGVPDYFEASTIQHQIYAETGKVYDESRQGYEGAVEYRYADFPLALGEAIMMNHALFAGLLYAAATPITDDPFHNQALSLKFRRAAQYPPVRKVLEDRAYERQIKANLLATAVLTDSTDSQLKLPILDPKLSLEDVLEYRHKHDAALQEARGELGDMAHRIVAEPWSAAFASDLEHTTIPNIKDKLNEVRRARDSWLKSRRGRLALKAASVVVGAATVALAVFVAQLTPVALATAGLSLATGAAIPGAEWLLDWRDGKRTVQENGLHYLLMYK
jgi:hypothetical protein